MLGRPLRLAGVALLAAALALNAATLTTAPALFGDESWYASTAWSAASGHGLEPSIAAGGGLYDGIPDYWASRVASLPHVAAEALLPTSLTLHRGVVLLTALLALGVFFVAMRRICGTELAIFACAAMAAGFGFYSGSHWVRWDAVALLFCCLVLLAFASGPPRPLAAAGAGALLGLAPDFAVALCGLFPGALVLSAWEREGRGARVGALLAGVLAGGLLFGLLHFGQDGVGPARDQYEAAYEPIYGELPLVEAARELSLAPLLRESDRYALMGFEPLVANFAVIAVGVLASLALFASGLGARRRHVAMGSAAALLLGSWALLGTEAPHAPLRHLTGLLIAGALASGLAFAFRGLRRSDPYPAAAAPAILLVSLLVGFAFLHGWKGGTYVLIAIPLAVAALATALRMLAPEGRGTAVAAAGLAAAALASGAYLVDQVRSTPEEPALDARLASFSDGLVAEDETVMGEWIYWWLFEDQRFVFNSAIWQQAWLHPRDTFAESFARVCPDFVLLDEIWLARYADTSVGRRFPNQAPTDPRERRRLKRLLRADYRLVDRRLVDGRRLAYWERRQPGCAAGLRPQPLGRSNSRSDDDQESVG